MSIKASIRTGSYGILAGLVVIVALSGYSLKLGGTDRPSPADDATVKVAPGAQGSAFVGGQADDPFGESHADDLVGGVHSAIQDGAEIYMTRCMSCHQMNGRGVPGVFPPLSGSEWVTGDKGVLIRITLNGMTGEVKVGEEVYSGAMPPWQTFLDDKQTSELLTYIRSAWENDTTAVTPEEVAAVRKAVEDRKEPWTAEELMEEKNQGIPGQKAETKVKSGSKSG